MTVNISLLIVTHNKLSYLRGTLLALQLLDYPSDDFEVVVVDDGSTDGTAAFLAEFEPHYRLSWRSQPNGGRAVARNAAASLASGRLLVIVDDDCLVHPAALGELWRRHQQAPASMLASNLQHIGMGHVPSLLEMLVREGTVPWPDLQDYLPIDREYALADLMRRVKTADMAQFAVPWIAAQGAGMALGADVFDRLGGFDERFVAWGMEDFDLGFRFSQSGGSFNYVAGALLYHLDHGHDKNVLFKESTVTTRALYAKFPDSVDIKQFTKFLCGAVTFKEFNNAVAAARGMAPIEGLNVRFSPYGMIRYRDQQLGAAIPAAAALPYSKAQQFRLRFLVERISRDIEPELATPHIFEKMRVEAGKSVLVIAPHMDDEVIGCGGLIAQYARAGARVTVLYLTDGAMRNLPQDEYAALCRDRTAESERAADILGVDRCLYLSIPERNLAALSLDPGPMRRALDECGPDIVLVPSELEHHPDHRIACHWLKAALAGPAGTARPAQVIRYEVWGSCRPNRLLALDAASWRDKVHALGMYQTQLKVLDYQQLMSYLNDTRGRCGYAPAAGARAEAYRQSDLAEFISS